MSIAHEHVFVDKHDSPAAPWHGIKNFQEPVCSRTFKKAEVRQCIISHLAYLPSKKCDDDH